MRAPPPSVPPRACAPTHPPHLRACRCSYAFGECCFECTKDQADELLDSQKEKLDGEVGALKGQIGDIASELAQLKAALYGRFGNNINLEE